jgi:hypothetical protein
MNIIDICHICGLLYSFDKHLTQCSGVLAQLELIADPYRFVILIANTNETIEKGMSKM